MYNTNEKVPTNPRNNCICDSGISCYYHVRDKVWYNKDKKEIAPVVWQYAILPSTMTASFENILLVLVNFGDNTFKQDFNSLDADKQQELFDELMFTKGTIEEHFEDDLLAV